ncbi:MAG TPA: ornithine cyclodeaminase family protein [Myxococcaceae bacterium]|nr:ornithine cyclodeaminase family protein [Myxococcaceae bacterium]
MRLLYLSDADVRAVGLPMAEILRALEAAFREKGEGRTEVPPKAAIHPAPEALLHAMPAWLPAQRAAGVKWVAAFPGNRSRRLPAVSGLIVLNDAETGLPVAVMDARWITAQRTGAATALAAKFLARPESGMVGLLGCGVQARSNLEALREVFSITGVRAFDRHPERAEALASEMRESSGVDAAAVAEPRSAVAGLDIVVTAGAISRRPHGTIQPGWLAEGAFASLVDFDSFWSREALREVDKFCTDDSEQLARFQEMGFFQGIPSVHADLGELAAGRKPGREVARERTVACNLGLALGDMASAALVYRRAVERGLGSWLPL